jgi:hypothetical protein
MAGKRIVFSTSTPNDQGFIIPNDVLDFTRFQKNPVLLRQHSWEELPLGLMTDIRYDAGEWTGVPVFHRMTELSRTYDDLWQSGFLTACSIGGFKELKTTGSMTRDKDGNKVPEIWTDKNGLGVATLFEVYEISMVTIPSNMDAVQKETFLKANADLNAKCYDEISVKGLEKEITTLSAKIQTMENEKEVAAKLAASEDEKVKNEAAAKLAADEKEKAELAAKAKADDLPSPIKEAVAAEDKKKSGLGATIASMFKDALDALSGTSMQEDRPAPNGKLEAPAPKNLPETDHSAEAKAKIYAPLPEKVGKMSAKEQAIQKLESAKEKATELQTEALAAKEKASLSSATQEEKDEFAAKKAAADEAFELCAKMESDVAEMDDTDEMKAEKKKEKLAANLAANKVRIKTMDELKADQVKLAAAPNNTNRVVFTGGTPKSMAQLKADPQGQKLIARVTNKVEDLEPAELAVYMSANRNDPKFKAVFDRTRIILGATDQNFKEYRKNNRSNPGDTVDAIISRLQSGRVNWLTKDGSVKEATTLNATDNFLASPDLYAMEFLDLAIFKLFPTTSWKNDIPMFGADSTEGNTGLIWANIAANPAIYMGTKPVNPTNYSVDDDAVALNLTSFWMQPMLWTPLQMAQLRYNQMDTQWAQAFAVLGTYIDDFLLYTLASAVPHSSIVYSSGIVPSATGGFSPVQQFTLNGNADNPNSFYYNTLFQGNLNYPTLNDIITLEQIYNKQNYELDNESPVVVMDSTTDSLIAQTTQSQSLLTRWSNDNGKEQLGFKHTKFNQRSRVVAFDPTTAQVKSPFGVIPSTTTSANLGFIPSQVGIGIGNLDVFMIQDPSAYGYKMSADVRMGITPLRKNANGLSMLAYGPGIIS